MLGVEEFWVYILGITLLTPEVLIMDGIDNLRVSGYEEWSDRAGAIWKEIDQP